MAGKIKATTLTGLQVSISAPPERKAMGLSIQGFKAPGEYSMARTEPIPTALRLIFSPLNDTTVPWPGSLNFCRGH